MRQFSERILIENVTGVRYREYMKKEVFEPLRMQKATQAVFILYTATLHITTVSAETTPIVPCRIGTTEVPLWMKQTIISQ